MATTLRRLFWLALLGGAGYAAWTWYCRRNAEQPEPVEPIEPVAAPQAFAPAAAWVPANDGTCPLTHPVKANDSSKIFHVPGGRFYDRTRPERCYATPEAATADGYRAAKS